MNKLSDEEIERINNELFGECDEMNMYCEGCQLPFEGSLEQVYCPNCNSTEICEHVD